MASRELGCEAATRCNEASNRRWNESNLIYNLFYARAASAVAALGYTPYGENALFGERTLSIALQSMGRKIFAELQGKIVIEDIFAIAQIRRTPA